MVVALFWFYMTSYSQIHSILILSYFATACIMLFITNLLINNLARLQVIVDVWSHIIGCLAPIMDNP